LCQMLPKIDVIHRASKPRSRSFVKAMEIMNTKASETAVIGDQIFTDIYGDFFVRLKRIAEKFVLAKMKTRKQI